MILNTIIALVFSFFISATANAAAIETVTEEQFLATTGLTEDTASSMIEKSLETLLFEDGDGISCGLEEFTIESYSINEVKNKDIVAFEIRTLADGPIDSCYGTKRYSCYTPISLKDGTWQAGFSECDFNEFGDD